MCFIKNWISKLKSKKQEKIRLLKLKELKVVIETGLVKNNYENINALKLKYQLENDEEMFEVEGICILMSEWFGWLPNYEIFEPFIGKYSMSSLRVQEVFTNLFDSVVLEMNTKYSIQNMDGIKFNLKGILKWNKHMLMCCLIVNIFEFSHNVIIGKNKNKIFDYIANIVDNCEYIDIVRMATATFEAFSINKIESWLIKRLDSLSNELDDDEIVWKKHENMGEVLRTMLQLVLKNIKHKEYYRNLFNEQLNNLATQYLIKILDYTEFNSQIMLLTILILEMMELKKILDLKWRKVLISKLTIISKLAKPNFTLLPNSQLNQSGLDLQIHFCARWCLENVLSANCRMDEIPPIKLSSDRFDARNDYYISAPVRSAFGVVSGVYYYEVTLLTVGQMLIGWSAIDTLFGEYGSRHHVVGTDKTLIGFVTFDKYILHDNKNYKIPNMPTLELYDVIGCLIDVDNQRFVFYHNGKCIFDKTLKTDFSSRIFYATANFSLHQQCHFNFGQHEFKHFPQNIELNFFHKSTNGDARKYRLLETENSGTIFWFKNFPFDNQINLQYTKLKVAQVNQETNNNNLLAYLKSIQWLLEQDIKMYHVYVGIFELFTNTIKSDKRNEILCCTKLWELVYPYTHLQINSTNRILCRNVCIAIIVVLQTGNLSHFIYQAYFKFLLSNKFFSIENFNDTPELITYALNVFGEFKFLEEDRQLLLNDQTLASTLQWSFQRYGQVENVSDLYDQNCDFVGLQAGVCARWFYEHVLSCKESQAVSTFVRQATLDPYDRSLRLKLTSDRLSARSYCGWQSIRSIAYNYDRYDIYYFEVILLTSGPMRIGWATKQTDLNETELGKDKFSVSYDGFNRCVRHDSEVYHLPDIPQWNAGDVIGCLLDKSTYKFDFSLNGQSISLPSSFTSNLYFSKHPYHAAISLYHHQQVYFNFGQAKFKYAPEQIDYMSIHRALEYDNTNQPSIDLQNVHNSIISYNSDVKTDDILIRQQIHKHSHSTQPNYQPHNQLNSSLDSNLIFINNSTNFNITPNSSSNSEWHKCIKTNSINPKVPSTKLSECRLCTESSSTKLVSFVCCLKLILCLDCAKLQPHCARCSKQQQSVSDNSSIRPLVECRLCFDQTQTRILQFTCCNTISLCLDCLKPFVECTECKKKTAITQTTKHQLDNVTSIAYTEEMDKVVSHFMNSVGSDTSGQAIVTCKFTNVFLKDLKTVQDNEWLNDSIVDFYFHLISERQRQGNYPKVHSFPKYVYDFIHSKDNPTQFTKDFNLFDYDILFFPMLKSGHWSLTVVDVSKKVVQYYDSLHNEDRAGVDEIVQFVNKVHFMNRSEVLDEWQIQYRVEGIPKQSNTFDCGVYVCKFAQYISRNAQIDFTQEHIPYFRKCIIYEVVTEKLLTD